MAFTGAATQSGGAFNTKILGLSLAAAASGTIGANGDTGADLQLPAAFGAILGTGVVVKVQVNQVTAGGGAGTPPEILSPSAPAGSPARITITNTSAFASGNLEIWVEKVHTIQQ